MKFIGAHIFDYDATFRGNVGIGTNNPQELVHIESTEPIIRFDDTNSGIHYLVGQVGDAFVFDTNNPAFSSYSFDANLSVTGTINLETSTSGGLPSFIIKDDARSGSAALNYIALTDSADAVHAKIGYLSGLNTEFTLQNLVGNLSVVSNNQMNINSGSDTVFLSSSSEKVRIKSDGKVGINQTSPVYTLDVGGNVGIRGGGQTTNQLFLNNGNVLISGDTSNQLFLKANDTGYIGLYTGGSERVRILNNGRVGIGTQTANAALDIQGSAADLRLTSTGQNRTALANTSTGFEISQIGNKAIYFLTNGTEKARISGGGTLGIATTSPDSNYKLDVNGKAQVRSVLELDDVLTLNAISTPADPGTNQSSIYMDSADGAIRVKINVGGTTVTRTLATFE